MASSSAKIYAPYGGGSKYYYTISINTEELALTDADKSNNTSSVKLTGKIKADGQIAFDGNSVHTLSVYWYDNNKNKSGKLVASKTMTALGIGAEISAATTISVEHLADGTLKGYGLVQFTKSGTNSYAPNSGSAKTQEAALITVPRATAISNYTATIGTPIKFEWTKASSSFTHTLTYTVGSVSETIGEGLVDYKEWTPPDKLYQQFPNAPSIDGTLYLTTYNGTTKIGETKSSKLTIKADKNNSDAVVEEFSIRDENTKTSTLTGDKTTLVLTKSIAFVTLVFKTRKYAKVKSVTINGKAVEVQAGTSSNGETNYGVTTDLGIATTGNFDLKITDTRDFPKETSTRNSVVDYIPLTATTLFKRIAPTTGKVGLTFEGNYFGQSFGDKPNTLTISYKYKKTNEANYSNEIIFVENTHYKTTTTKYYSGTGSSKQTLELAPTFDYKSAYNLTFDVKDELTTYPTIYVTVVKGIPIVWWNGSKFVANGTFQVANAEGTVQTTISGGNISTTGTLSANGKRADILLQNKFASRPTNANIGTDASGGLCKFLSTGSMTSNKPSNDGHIMHMYWDTDAGWDSQLFVGNGSDPAMRIRGQNAGTWGSWKNVAMEKDAAYKRVGTNLYNYARVAPGLFVVNNNQAINASTNYVFSGYIPVKPNTKYTRSDTGIALTTFMNYGKAWLSGVEATTFTTPNDCYFIGFNIPVAKYNDGSYKKYMVNEGATLKAYQDYVEPTIVLKTSDGVEREFPITPKNENDWFVCGSIYDFQKYLCTNAVPPFVSKCFHLSLNGLGASAFVQKTSNAYQSFIYISYSGNAAHYKCLNGTWSSTNLY